MTAERKSMTLESLQLLARAEIRARGRIRFRSAVIAPPDHAREISLSLTPRPGRLAERS